MSQSSFLPRKLRAWRAAFPEQREIIFRGSIVELRESGKHSSRVAHFNSIDDATRAAAEDTIVWRRT